MSLLNRILKILGNEKTTPEQNLEKKVEFKDLIFDWFRAGGLSVEDFKKDFYEPCMQLYLSEPRTAKYFEEYFEQATETHFNNHAVVYAAYHYPNNEWFQKLLDFVLDRDNRVYGVSDFIRISDVHQGLFAEHDDLRNIINIGRYYIRYYHAIFHQGDQNISSVYNISNYVARSKSEKNTERFKSLFKYVKAQQFEGKPFFFTDVYCSKDIDYATYEEKTNPELQALARQGLIDAVAETNQKFDLQLDAQILMDFGDTVLARAWNERIMKMDHKKQKRLKVKDFPQVVDFVKKYKDRKEEAIENMIYYFRFTHIHGHNIKFYAELISELLKGGTFDESHFEKLTKQELGSGGEFAIKHIFCPIFNSLSGNVSYDSNIRKNFEENVFKSITRYQAPADYQSAWDMLAENSKTIPDKLEGNVMRAKYGPLFCNTVVNHNSHLPAMGVNDGKKAVHKWANDIVQMTQKVLPVALKSIQGDNVYYAGNAFFTLNVDGTDLAISTNVLQDLNKIFKEKQVGYRYVPVPIMKKIQNGYPYYLSSVALLNFEEYHYFEESYLAVNFEEAVPCRFYNEIEFVKMDAPSIFAEGKSDNSGAATTSQFLSNPNWNWFKNQYIDELASKEQWYSLMDVMLEFKGGKKPNKQWLNDIQKAINDFGVERYFKELGVLIPPSLKEEFWFLDNYNPTLKAMMWTCAKNPTDQSLTILRTITAAAYTKIRGLGPRSTATGNLGLEALATSGSETAFGILNLMRNKSKYPRFVKAIDKYLAKFTEHSDVPQEVLADRSIPNFGFENGQKITPISPAVQAIFKFKDRKLVRRWIFNGKETSKAPENLKVNFKTEQKEIAGEFKNINAVYKDLSHRIKTYWLYDRTWEGKEWQKNIYGHPLLFQKIQGLIWKNESTGDAFITNNDQLFSLSGNEYAFDESHKISLWHPITAADTEIKDWQKFIIENKIEQPLRQAFREHYPFSETELAMDSTPRFSHHFLVVRKLMAIAASAGWTFTYVHEDISYPRVYVKNADLTCHFKCDYNRNDFAIPTKELLITKGNTTKIGYNAKPLEPIPFKDVAPKTLSELCRDIDLFVATTSISNDPTLSQESEKMKFYREDFARGKFSDNASAKVRKQIIEQLTPVLKLKVAGFEGNYLLIEGTRNTYRINLGSGFAQIKGSQKHINLLPDIQPMKKSKKIHVPVQDDETLYIILAKALFLQNDGAITDEKILGAIGG